MRDAPRVALHRVGGDREPFLPILMAADSSEGIVRTYMDDGELFEIRDRATPIGAALLLRDGPTIEIKNLALLEEHRGRGLGRASIRAIVAYAGSTGARELIVGTADSEPGTIEFYRKVGFRDSGLREGFFDRYPEPVEGSGGVAHDMVMFAMDLG